MKTKILLGLVLPMFLLAIFAGGALAAEKPRVLPVDGAQPPGKYVGSSPAVYEGTKVSDCTAISRQVTIVQGPDTWAMTYYDEQQVGSMGRMIAVGPGGHRHMCCQETRGPFPAFPRYVTYNCKDPVNMWLGPVFVDGGPGINAGYCQMLTMHDGREIILYHRDDPTDNCWSMLAVGDEGFICQGFFTNLYDLPDRHQGQPNDQRGHWPKGCIVYDAETDTDYIHIVTTESIPECQAEQTIAYQRCVFQGNNLVCHSPSGLGPYVRTPNVCNPNPFDEIHVIDEITTFSAVIVSSPVSKRVAIVYTKPRGGASGCEKRRNNDVVYCESMNNGEDWFAAHEITNCHNITNYAPLDPERAYTDVAAVYDYNDSLHIAFNAAKCDSPAGEYSDDACNLYHWCKEHGITVIAPGQWGGTNPGAWNLNLSKMSISAKDPIYHPGGDPDSVYVFCTWTQFDSGDVAANGFSNGDIYASVSNNGGLTWTRGFNLTNTKTPGCLPGECLSEHWSSMAENMYDGDLHIEYVCDRDAGAVIQGEGAWVDDDMIYLHVYQLPVEPHCGISVTPMEPPSFCEPPIKVAPGGSRVITFRLTGLYNLGGGYTVTTNHPKVTCTANCAGFLAPGDVVEVEMTIDCMGQDEFIDATITITGCIGTPDETTIELTLHAVCSEDYYECPRDPATYIEKDNCKLKAKFWVNSEERVWDKRIYPECKQQVIFSASSIVATSWDGDTIVGRQDYCDVLTGARDTIHHVVGIDPDQPECALQVVWTHNTFICANNLAPPNHLRWWWIDIHKQIFMWHDTSGMQCPNWKKEQIIKQMWIDYSEPPVWWPDQSPYTGHEDIYFGFFADVNAPDDSCWGANFAGYDAVREMIWHSGLGPPPQFDDYFIGHTFTDRNGGVVAPFGCQDVLNRDYLWPNCGGWGWLEEELYELAATPGVNIHNPGVADDRTVVLTADMIPAGTGSFFSEYILIEAFIETGLADLQAHIDQTRAVLIPHLDLLGLFDQCPICGDINEDGIIDAADIIYLLNYLFVPGSPPPSWPLSRADVNGDGILDAADIVMLLNHLYVPPPGIPPLVCPGFGR